MTALRIALLGAGTVGAAVAHGLLEHPQEYAARIGAPYELVGIAVRGEEDIPADLPRHLFTFSAAELVQQADIVIELIGGIEPARTFVMTALESGAAVVTANKALLGAHGPELYAAAAAAGVDLAYEAAVAGAIPLLRPLRESLAGDRVQRVMGIVNGTTNFILDEMHTTGADLPVVLAQAQELGYAEADPTADVAGYDAQAKAAILASLAFHVPVRTADVFVEGIMDLTAQDIKSAQTSECVIKLLAIAQKLPATTGHEAGISVRVHPTLVPQSHPLANVRGAFNAVFVETELAGELMFYGKGAGGAPTSSAVLGDVMQVARNRITGSTSPRESAHGSWPILSIDAAHTRYSIRMDVTDKAGVLAEIGQVFGRNRVSIASIAQVANPMPGTASITVVTHESQEQALSATVQQLHNLAQVQAVTSVVRVEGT